ncbi:hypothetical protein SAMD00019534_083940 [Acytostelium subglobosum LB1]|uniref:hypothetical protein n=1 Tax=Acytostelium subglobosum LB1 TaxID=1410327 RepID=UPI000644FB0C|nr:hypothetical protein SAMD00019534_083940 [Acytostelium subglobosum LB1]GAM25219.1 hypothetical protein SAMD00019534_083940 [Acytostelium subglobosum LB1]|eukprot:XP_012751739.1 hypothetical protein SAMD00019534_083940 [Acytostelium subglobosum LB1]
MANVSAVSILGITVFAKNLRNMNLENHFEIPEKHLLLEKSKNIMHPTFHE